MRSETVFPRFVFFALMFIVSAGCDALPSYGSRVNEESEKNLEGDPFTGEASSKRMPTLEDSFPYLRFQKLSDGRVRALIPFPAGANASGALKVIEENCICFSRIDSPATISFESGYVVRGDPSTTPWSSSHSMVPTEDLFIVTGAREDIFETLEFVDLFFNNAPQIEIQVQIIEISDSDAFERGVENLTINNLKDGLPYDEGSLVASGVDSDGNLIYSYTDSPTSGSGPFGRSLDFSNSPATLDAGGGFALAIIQDSFVLDAILKLVKTTSAADIVSRPRVVVRNGQAALLTSQEKIPYQKFTNINTSGNSASALDMLTVGVDLKVLPVIVGSDTIHLSIDAKVSRVGRNIVVATDVTAPSTSDRSAKTEVAVPSGQSVVIGGLKLKETKNNETKIPLLGDIPVLGWLFSYSSVEQANTEVLFIITPLIKTRGASISRFGDIFDPFADDSED